jgi:hypothetical protein
MRKDRLQRLDVEIQDLLNEAALHSNEDQTVWMDVSSIAWVLLDSHTIGARRKVRQRLFYLLAHGLVERRNFDGQTGWRLLKDAADKFVESK